MNSDNGEVKALNRALEIMSGHVRLLEERYRVLTETVIDGIITIDKEESIIFCNPAAKKMFGYDDEIIGNNIVILMPERYQQAYREGINRYLKTGLPSVIGKTIELVGLKKDGTEFPVELSLSVWKSDKRCYFTGTIRDITERKRMENSLKEVNKKLENLSIRDSLTNLYNRRYAYEVLESEFNRTKRYNKTLSCLMIDIDYFKRINDLYGHLFGDKVLSYFSSFLLEMTRSTDVISRYGGEEFLIILTEVSINGAVDFAERLREAILMHKIEDKEKNIHITLTVSIGVSSYTGHVSDKEELVHQADMALYEAKRTGRNRVCCYKPSLTKITNL
jgi:diguanylate cyclase (GGDEF)-like protein/PAS domain S-box-containing protein